VDSSGTAGKGKLAYTGIDFLFDALRVAGILIGVGSILRYQQRRREEAVTVSANRIA
jgi:hypothetical protein